MNKEDMIAVIAANTGFTKRDSERALEAVLDTITKSLYRGDKVNLVGFGTFEVKNRAPRMGRNPKENKPHPIPARKVPYFTPGKVFKHIIENSPSYTKK